jgi:transposase
MDGRLNLRAVATEACASAHHWSGLLVEQGHDMRLIPPAHAKP